MPISAAMSVRVTLRTPPSAANRRAAARISPSRCDLAAALRARRNPSAVELIATSFCLHTARVGPTATA